MFQNKPVVGQHEENEKNLSEEINQFNKQFKIRDDTNRMDLLLLSSVDLGFNTKDNILKRSRDLKDLVQKSTSVLALVT